MKKLLIIALVLLSFVAEAQLPNLILNDNNDYDSLSFRRKKSFVWVPTWDNNARLFYMPHILNDPKIADLICIIESLTTPGVYVPLSENLRFYNNVDKLAFISFAETAGAFVQQNDIGDVVINNDLYNLFDLYPSVYEDALTKAELIDRYQELLDLGLIWPIPYPVGNTPIYTGCN